MAVTTSYSFGFVESIDPVNITSRSDAASLSGGGVVAVGDHIGHVDITTFEADGDVAGSAVVIPGVDAAVTQLSNGNIVVFSDIGTDMSFRIVSTAGITVVTDTAIGEGGPDVLDPEVAALTGGGFVLAYQDFFGGTDNDINIQIRDNTGALVTSITPDGSGANDQNPSVAGLNDGGFAVAWHRNIGSSNEMWYAVYNANGTVRLAPTLLDNIGTVNRNASVVALQNGGFAIAYEDNGWTPGDIDITLARFDSAGSFVDWDDITQNGSNDTGPSATVLSNGMIAVGLTNDVFGDTDTRVVLVDQNTGAALATSTIGGSVNNELEASIAAMSNGQIGAFYTDATAGDVIGAIRQATRFSTGDAAADTITGDDLRDVVSGGDGSDTIRGGENADNLSGDVGNDTFTYGADEVRDGEIVDGGADFDRILALADANFFGAVITSIEEIEFNFPNAAPTTVQVRADQIGVGLAANLLVDGNQNNQADTLRIVMDADTSLTLAGFTFQNWITGPAENDRILIVGDDDAETIVGSSERDEIYGRGGNDTIKGSGGADEMRGGLGNDRYYVDNSSDEVIESAGQGNDTIVSSVSETLAANVDDLVLTGVAAIDGTGNTLNNVLTGNSANNKLQGLAGDDVLDGADGADVIVGGVGADELDGDSGADIYDYNALNESTVAAAGRDTIVRFSRTEGDEINLSTIDANTGAGGNQVFTFIGTDVFTGAGQLRYEKISGDRTIIYGNVNGGLSADFAILVDQKITFQATDFAL